jgi:hypothetical protein
VLLAAGCVAPIGADRVTTQQSYAQVDENALRTGRPSANTVSILHRYDLDRLAVRHPDEAVRQLHQQAVATGERELLFALAELSYVAGDQIRRSVKPWDPRDARDYYLGSAVYAWLFLFGEGKDATPSAFDRRFREACDFYNYGLGLALTGRRSTNAIVHLESGPRRLPVRPPPGESRHALPRRRGVCPVAHRRGEPRALRAPDAHKRAAIARGPSRGTPTAFATPTTIRC